jgi:hypothetical protein
MVEDAVRYLYKMASKAPVPRKKHEKAHNQLNILLMALKSSDGQLNQQRRIDEERDQNMRNELPTDAHFPDKPDTSNVTTMRPREKHVRRNVE